MSGAKVPAALNTLHHGGAARFRFELSPDGLTYIANQRVAYPFHVTRPFYLEGDPDGMPTLYLQSVSGGLFDGDTVQLRVDAEPGARAQITTQASTIVHEMRSRGARQHLDVEAHPEAYVEYLPDPLVLFPNARLTSRIRVTAAPSATVVLTDGFLGHDPKASNRCFARFASELRITSPDGRLRCLDRFEVTGPQLTQSRRFSAHGSVICIDETLDDEARSTLGKALEAVDGVYAGVSALPDGAGLWGRVLANDSHALRNALNVGWSTVRELKTGLRPQMRRK